MIDMSNMFVMPYLCIGEIVEVTDPVKDENDEEKSTSYTVLVEFPNGSKGLCPNAIQACLFGGIGDFFQTRLRATKDIGEFEPPSEKEKMKGIETTIGDRVLIMFVGGDMRRPIIVGYLPHPKRKLDIPEKDITDTQAKLSYKGFEVLVNTLGETTLIHRGSPVERDIFSQQETKANEIKDVGPKDLTERESSEGNLPQKPISPNKPPKLLEKPKNLTPSENEGLLYPDEKYTTEMGFGQLGEWYLVDNESQSVFLDRDSKTITITNGAEIIQIDKEHQKIFIESSGDYEFSVKGNSYSSIEQNKNSIVGNDQKDFIKANEYRTIGDSRNTTVVNEDKNKIGTLWHIEVGNAEKITGAKGSANSKHSAKIVLSTGNTFFMDDDQIYLKHKTEAQVLLDSKGTIMATAKDKSSVVIDADSKAITATSSKKAVVKLDDKVSIKDGTGSQSIDMKDGLIEIKSSKEVNVVAKEVNVKSGKVTIGENASMSAVLGENLQKWLDQHTHVCGTGTSSPPVLPTTTYTSTPQDILSKSVKVKS